MSLATSAISGSRLGACGVPMGWIVAVTPAA
jgi:hypothetical protein